MVASRVRSFSAPPADLLQMTSRQLKADGQAVRFFSDDLLQITTRQLEADELEKTPRDVRIVVKRTFWDLELVDLQKDQGANAESDGDTESIVDLASEASDLDWAELSEASDENVPCAVCLVGPWVWQPNSQLPSEEASATGLPSDQASESLEDVPQTTILITNVPNLCTTADLSRVLNSQGLQGCYDFVCVPFERKTKLGYGWALVNMVSQEAAECAMKWLDNCKSSGAQTGLKVTWYAQEQGFTANVKRYSQSDLHQVASDLRPMIFDRCGARLPYPVSAEEFP